MSGETYWVKYWLSKIERYKIMWVLGVLVICFILIPPSRRILNPILNEEGKEVDGRHIHLAHTLV